MQRLPAGICKMTCLTHLNLAGNSLDQQSLPPCIAQLSRLRVLFFLGNAFTEVPPVIASLSALETLSFKKNRLRQLGEDTLPVSLRALIVTNNELQWLPRSLGKLSELRKLMASRNRCARAFTSLPLPLGSSGR